jgi:hypothetical protein
MAFHGFAEGPAKAAVKSIPGIPCQLYGAKQALDTPHMKIS